MAKKKTKIEVEESSGHVFADLGLPNPEQELLKAGLTLEIYRILVAALGHDVEIRVMPTRKAHGQVSVIVAA